MSDPFVTLAVSIGCPSSIGPEVSVLAASSVEGAVTVLVGDAGVVARAASLRRVDTSRLVRIESPGQIASLVPGDIAVLQPTAPLSSRDARPGRPSKRGGAAQLAWIDAASDLVQNGYASALVTGPVSKSAIARSGAPGASLFLGHTEHLQRRLAAKEVVMAFWCEAFTTSLVTTHVPLSRVPRAVTAAAVASSTFWLSELLARLAEPRHRPRVAVVSLNPHAGESGLLGGEEASAIAPGIVAARARAERAGLSPNITGPVPAETAFRVAAKGGYDGVVAMYHDQATIPMKLVGFGEAVNVSLGLPIVRTSVDHGTAYDIAGQGVASDQGMLSAMRLAVRLTRTNLGGRRSTPRGRARTGKPRPRSR